MIFTLLSDLLCCRRQPAGSSEPSYRFRRFVFVFLYAGCGLYLSRSQFRIEQSRDWRTPSLCTCNHMLKICWTLSNEQPLGVEQFFCLTTAGNNDCEDQAPGGHARPSLGVQKLGNNQVDFSVPFVGVFQFKQKSGESNRHFASLRLCSSCSQLDRYCPYICRCEMFRTEVVAKNKTHVVCPYWELRSSGSLRSA